MKKILIDLEKLKKIKNEIDEILPDEVAENKSIKKGKAIYKKYDFSEKEKKIYDFIRDHPGAIKQYVVNNLGKYSRVPILSTIDCLERDGFIIVKEDEYNSQLHHLFINHDNSIVSLIENIRLFKKNYFDLITKTITKKKELDDLISKKMYNQDFDLGKNSRKTSEIHDSLVFPFNFLTIINLITNIQPWIKSPSEIEVIHRKFAIFNNTLQEILSKLFISFSYDKEPNQEGAKKITLHLFWQNFAFNAETILNYLITFKGLYLSVESEKVLDSLWKLGKPILGCLSYDYYEFSYNESEAKDWRNIIRQHFQDKYIPHTVKS